MTVQSGKIARNSGGSGLNWGQDSEQGLSVPVAAAYLKALKAARTPGERTLVPVMRAEHERLRRPPTVRELQIALTGSPLGGLSTDWVRKIQQNIVGRLKRVPHPIHFTRDRPPFRHIQTVRAEYESFVNQHKQPPTFAELRGLLAEKGVSITVTSLENTLKVLRLEAASGAESFRLSRRRIAVTTSQIEAAYGVAREYLRKVEISSAPSAALVAKFLRRSGHQISSRALEFRFQTSRELSSLKLSPYRDPGDKIILKAHRQFEKRVGRPPTARELATEFNSISIERGNADSIWTRVSRINKKLPAKQRLQLSQPCASGIYDVDVKRVEAASRLRLGRPPTLKELRRTLLESVPGSKLSLDAMHRRSKRLGLSLTSEYKLTKEAQLLIVRKINSLLKVFGRRPSGAEVREALKQDGIVFSEKTFLTSFGSAKRHRDERFRLGVRLNQAGRIIGNLGVRYETQLKNKGGYPSAEQLAKSLGWTALGVQSALPLAQSRAARLKIHPVVLSNTLLADALDALTSVVRGLGASILEGHASDFQISSKHHALIKSMVGEWKLPELPIGDSFASLTFDEKFARCEQWWVLITCLNAPATKVSDEYEFRARVVEAKLGRIFGIGDARDNPIAGFVQVLQVAHSSGRLSTADFRLITQQAAKAQSIGECHSILRTKLMNLASQCGFPRPRVADLRKRSQSRPHGSRG